MKKINLQINFHFLTKNMQRQQLRHHSKHATASSNMQRQQLSTRFACSAFYCRVQKYAHTHTAAAITTIVCCCHYTVRMIATNVVFWIYSDIAMPENIICSCWYLLNKNERKKHKKTLKKINDFFFRISLYSYHFLTFILSPAKWTGYTLLEKFYELKHFKRTF